MPKEKITTIKIREETKSRLDNLKEHEKESYEEVIKKALNILNIARRSPLLGARILRDIERGKKRENLIENPERILRRKKQPQETQITRNVEQNIQRMKSNIRS